MSINRRKELTEIAKVICRELRKRSTDAEKILWEELRSRKLTDKKFYRQYPFFYDINGKESFFVADFFCFEGKLIIELDGQIHDYRLKEDSERTEILSYPGLRVIRFRNDEVEKEIGTVLGKIKKELELNP